MPRTRQIDHRVEANVLRSAVRPIDAEGTSPADSPTTPLVRPPGDELTGPK